MDRNERHFEQFYTPRSAKKRNDKENREQRRQQLLVDLDASFLSPPIPRSLKGSTALFGSPPLPEASTSTANEESSSRSPSLLSLLLPSSSFSINQSNSSPSPPGSSRILRRHRERQQRKQVQQQQQQQNLPESSFMSPPPPSQSKSKPRRRLLDSGAKRVAGQKTPKSVLRSGAKRIPVAPPLPLPQTTPPSNTKNETITLSDRKKGKAEFVIPPLTPYRTSTNKNSKDVVSSSSKAVAIVSLDQRRKAISERRLASNSTPSPTDGAVPLTPLFYYTDDDGRTPPPQNQHLHHHHRVEEEALDQCADLGNPSNNTTLTANTPSSRGSLQSLWDALPATPDSAATNNSQSIICMHRSHAGGGNDDPVARILHSMKDDDDDDDGDDDNNYNDRTDSVDGSNDDDQQTSPRTPPVRLFPKTMSTKPKTTDWQAGKCDTDDTYEQYPKVLLRPLAVRRSEGDRRNTGTLLVGMTRTQTNKTHIMQRK